MVRFLPLGTSTRLSVGVPYSSREYRVLYIVEVPGTPYQIFVNLAPGDPGRDLSMWAWLCMYVLLHFVSN
eukprot:SAG31_NODE_41311_length_263_cov_1.644068_1_plen_69_part_01